MENVDVIGYLIGLFVGIIMGMIGGGGSVLLPTFVYLLDKDSTLATAYTLFLVGVTALFGVIPRVRNKEVDFPTAITLGVPILLGTLLVRGWLTYRIPDFIETETGETIPYVLFAVGNLEITKRALVLLIFATILLLSFASMIGLIGSKMEPNPNLKNEKPFVYFATLLISGFFIGILSAFIGAGGGVMIVPLLVIVMGLPMKTVVGTSLAIMAGKSIIGFSGDIYNGGSEIEWGFLTVFSVIMVIGIAIGSYASNYVSGDRLKIAFGWFILALAIFIFASEFGLIPPLRGAPAV